MEDRSAGPIAGSGLGTGCLAPMTYPLGRGCSEPGCQTILSIYNPGCFCAEHESRAAVRVAGRRPPREGTAIPLRRGGL
jgi:hypothetical protein